MRQQRKKEVAPTGPALKGEDVAELWVFTWSAIDELRLDSEPHARDEAMRLAVAFNRAIATRQNVHDFPTQRFVRDQDPVSTALLAHYLLTRVEQWTAALQEGARAAEAVARLRIVEDASELFGVLLGVTPRELSAHFERLGVGLSRQSVLRTEAREGVTIESVEEGPVLPDEYALRSKEARDRMRARWDAESGRPKKRRALTGGQP